VSPVEQEVLTLPEHLSSSRVFRGIRVTRSLVVAVCFVDSCIPILFGSLYCLDHRGRILRSLYDNSLSNRIYLSMLIVDAVYCLKTQIHRKQRPISVMMFYEMVLHW
jgi:hypothetical protein